VVVLNIHVFWVVRPCRLVNGQQRFEESCCFHLQGQAVQESFLGLLGPEDEGTTILLEVGSYTGADKSLARPGRKRLTGHLQLRRNWHIWASNILTTHPILRIWPRRTTTCSLD
jgi:hypothetical protein